MEALIAELGDYIEVVRTELVKQGDVSQCGAVFHLIGEPLPDVEVGSCLRGDKNRGGTLLRSKMPPLSKTQNNQQKTLNRSIASSVLSLSPKAVSRR